MNANQWLTEATKKLGEAGIDSARLDSLILLEKVLKIDRTKLLADPLRPLSDVQLEKANRLLEKRAERVPVAYLIGYKEFYGRKIKLNRNVLIPRPETELIVEWTVKHAPENARLLDLGTGSGAIAIAIALERKDLKILASDIAKAATALAERNADNLGARVKFVVSDMFENLKGQFEVITANLPYIAPGEKVDKEVLKEPKGAVFSSGDGLDHYRALAAGLDHHKKHGTAVVIEHLPSQSEAIRDIFKPIATKIDSVGPFTSVIWT